MLNLRIADLVDLCSAGQMVFRVRNLTVSFLPCIDPLITYKIRPLSAANYMLWSILFFTNIFSFPSWDMGDLHFSAFSKLGVPMYLLWLIKWKKGKKRKRKKKKMWFSFGEFPVHNLPLFSFLLSQCLAALRW